MEIVATNQCCNLILSQAREKVCLDLKGGFKLIFGQLARLLRCYKNEREPGLIIFCRNLIAFTCQILIILNIKQTYK